MSLLILCIIQAITEFMPVSSTAHMLLFGHFFSDINNNDLLIHVALHLGTLAAIVVFYAKTIAMITMGTIKGALFLNHRKNEYFKKGLMIIIATLPAIVVGYFLKPYISTLHNNLMIIAICSILFGGLLMYVDLYNPQDQDEITLKDAFFIGLGQLFAFIPGGSRLGTTVTVARILNKTRLSSFDFSMLLSIPVVLGAVILTAYDAYKVNTLSFSSNFSYIFQITFFISLCSLFVMHKFINRIGYGIFGIYRIIFGLFLLSLIAL